MKILILAAGQGKRLRPLTNDIPKCMVKYKNKPIIDYIINSAKNFGINDIAVVSGYKKNVLKKSIKIARDLSLKPENAMILTKRRLWQIFKADLNETFKAAIFYHMKSFNSGEPQKVSKKFLKK